MSQNVSILMGRGITNNFMVEISEYEPMYPKIFKTSTIQTRYRDSVIWQNYPLPSRRDPNTPVPFAQFMPSFGHRAIVDNYGLGDTLAKEDVADDLYGVMHKFVPMRGGGLARMFTVLFETQAFGFIANLGYVAGTGVAGMNDGVCLFSANHPTSANIGTLLSNRLTGDPDLSVASYHAARANLVAQKAPNGIEIIRNKPRCLCVNPNLHQVARQVLYGNWERGTGDRNENVVRQDNVELVEAPYFQSSGTAGALQSPPAWNSWFIVGQEHYLYFLMRAPFDIDVDFDVYVKAHVYTADARFTEGADDWRGTVGSLGQ